MKNYIQEGEVLPLTAPYALASGEAFRIDSIFAVAEHAADNAASVQGAVCGVFELPKKSADVVTVGKKLNWKDSTKELQIASGDLDGVATAIAAAGAGVTKVKVMLVKV